MTKEKAAQITHLFIGITPFRDPASLTSRRTVLSEEGQIGHGIRKFLIRHGRIGKHACAGMSFANGLRALLVVFQTERF